MALATRTIARRAGGIDYEGLLVCDDAKPGERPGILIAPTIRGRTRFEEEKAQALAALGYAALVIDLYGRDTRAAGMDQLRALMGALKDDRAALQSALNDWLETLRGQQEVDPKRVGAVGFCFGGLCVLDLVRSGAAVNGVVSFHGIFDPPPDPSAASSSARVLALHGWDDPLATPDRVLDLARELSALGADWQIHAYGNTLHAFTNPAADDRGAGTVYNAAADRRSWTAMRNFFDELFDAPASA